ncbi:MAG: DEAD/DEAH box helicase [Succinivibrio sp.]|nr:DEAD/DEAH box helicase [Succinivibrio sp.]
MAEAEQSGELLAKPLQKWIYKKGWHDLNPLQKAALRPILKQQQDIIISASTASGKTEAAFLPALSAIVANPQSGVRLLYISPLKALINDQYRRLTELTAELQLPVTPWHGDIDVGRKEKLLRHPEGIVLTTPESLESLLIHHLSWLKEDFTHLAYVIIDEFHVFMGSQRGYQLQSQLHRLDNLCCRRIPRIALSATFAEDDGVIAYLRPNCTPNALIIKDPCGKQDVLKVQIRGYEKDAEHADEADGAFSRDMHDIAADIFRLLRGSTNLVFCNSRAQTEHLATLLQRQAAAAHVPNEFFPHHGSLAKDLRESLEQRLIDGRLPTTAICTATLELGIDISELHSIAQVAPPSSVSSLRQRLGRSGRRDHSAVLRLFISQENALQSHLRDELAEDTVLAVAMVKLLLKHWYEPPQEHEFAFSTLVQQTLSVIASLGSASAKQLWELLCHTGPFSLCDQKIFMQFLKSLGAADLLVQLNDKTLTLGLSGEKLVSNWNFYASFKTPDEYTIEHDHKNIGTVPLTEDLPLDTTFLFAGKAWKVVFLSHERRIIGVKPYPHEALPLAINGNSGKIHDVVRREMFRLYQEGEIPPFLNKQAREHFQHALLVFRHFDLEHTCLVEGPSGLALFPWRGDRVMRTIIALLRKYSIKGQQQGSHIELGFTSRDSLKEAVQKILHDSTLQSLDLVPKQYSLCIDKYDEFLSPELLRLSYARSALDLDGALEFIAKLEPELRA